MGNSQHRHNASGGPWTGISVCRNPASDVNYRSVKAPAKSKKHARAVADGKVKSAGKMDKARRAADEAKK